MIHALTYYPWLIGLGFVVGAFGTFIGAGGGFVLVPILLLLYPNENPEIITSISLAVVFFNALSGSWAYAWMKRIDYQSGLRMAAATIPGAVLGALTTNHIPRRLFDITLGLVMIVASVYLYFNRSIENNSPDDRPHTFVIHHIEKNGTAYRYSYSLRLGLIVSFSVGFFSSLMGIGGGIIHVPVLTHLLNFPVHIATATSHFMLAIMALTGTMVHILTGTFSRGIYRTIALSVGVVIGAQVGAKLSTYLQGSWIIKSLALALAFAGIRLILPAW